MSDEIKRLLRATQDLAVASGVRLVVIGGVARGAWALERNTFDLDVIAETDDFAAILQAAPAAGLVAVARDIEKMAKSGMTRLRLPDHLSGEVRLDVIGATHPYYRRVVERAVTARVYDVDVSVACAADIVILKTMAARPQDTADVAAIVAAQGDALDKALVRRELVDLGFDVPDLLR